MLAVLLSLWAISPPLIGATPDGFRIDGFQWEGDPLPGGWVTLYNPFGDIRARAAQDNRIHLNAVIQKFRPEHEQLTFSITQEGDGPLRISPHYPEPEKLGRARVDITLLLPPGTHLEARTTGGLIKIARFESTLHARTESGAIKIASAHPVSARSASGAISARFTQRRWRESSWLESGTGEIRVTLNSEAEPGLRIRAGGEIHLQPSETLRQAAREERPGGLWIRAGQGEQGLFLFARHGEVHLDTRVYPTPQRLPAH